MFEISIMMPDRKLFNIAIPTVPIINIGPLTEQNDSIFFASLLVICLFSNFVQINLAPIGYPDKVAKKKVEKLPRGVL